METPVEIAQMKIYVSSTDTFHGSAFYQAIAIEAKNFGLFGATVYSGMFGFGVSSRHIDKKFWEVAEKVPIIIELNDEREQLLKFLNRIRPWFTETRKGFLVTISPTEIILKKDQLGATQTRTEDLDFVP
jgi:hypothetical protein